jgi:3'-phosphoadenosine 5'-phosphosulfate sulfotransferase (PAPS reductase)/FAD synthetase
LTVAQYSGGAASHVACMRVKPDVLLFADTGEEHPSLYEALESGSKALGVPLVKVHADGYMDGAVDIHRSIPSSMLPFCSRDLKIVPCLDWLRDNAPGATLVIGYTWDEINRVKATRDNWAKHGFTCVFPLTEKPYLNKYEIVEIFHQSVPNQPLYEANLPHNNCGGACVKAGITQWKWVLENDPERFARWEAREQRISDLHGKPCSILKRYDKPYPLKKLRSDVESQCALPFDEWGGCGCFSDGWGKDAA